MTVIGWTPGTNTGWDKTLEKKVSEQATDGYELVDFTYNVTQDALICVFRSRANPVNK